MDTKQAILADLQRVAEQGNLTRNLYRDLGNFETFEIEKHFGTFSEAKTQAGLTATRIQRQLQGQIAKHVSFDRMRELNVDRADYGDKYRKESGKRFQTVLCASDLHDKEMDPFWRHIFIDTVKRMNPDKIVLVGDVFDLPEFGKYSVDPRTWDAVGRIKYVHSFLEELREAAPDAEIIFIEGNHEYRLLRYLAEQAPELRAVLSDLHGMTVSSLLGLDKFEIRYVARGDLAAWNKGDMGREVAKNYEVLYDSILFHHHPEGAQLGLPGFNGHHHQFQARSVFHAIHGPGLWIQLGCGHQLSAEYCDPKWNMGFGGAHIDTERGRVSQFHFGIEQQFAEVGGKFYYRA